MKRYLRVMIFSLSCVILFSSVSVMAVTTESTTDSASSTISPAADETTSTVQNQIKKIVTLFMGWQNGRLITKDGEYTVDENTKLYDFVNSKRFSNRVAGKAMTELIFVDDTLKIIIIKPGKTIRLKEGEKP